MRDAVVRLSSCQCLVKLRVVFSSTPKTRYVSLGPMEGMGVGVEFREMNCESRRDARRVVLALVRALPVRQRAPVMQHLRMLTVMPV